MAKKRKRRKAKPAKYEYRRLPKWGISATPQAVAKGAARKERRVKKYADIQRIQKAKEEIYRREHPVETRVKEKAKKIGKTAAMKLERWGKKRVVSKPLLKKPKVTIVIKRYEEEPYHSIYFDKEYKEEKKNLYFK